MKFWNYVFGPKLYMEYNMERKMYEPGGLEKFGDQILSTLSLVWNLGLYTSPLIATFLYRKGYFVADSISSLLKFSTSVGLIVVISLCMRGFGRSQSRPYVNLMKAFDLTRSPKTSKEGKETLRKYDFEFVAWQVDFDVAEVQGGDGSKRSPSGSVASASRSNRSLTLATLPCHLAAYVAIHTFGIRLMYPGSLKLLQSYMRPMLVAGRAKMIEQDNARRFKVRTADKNEIDTIFVDKRDLEPNGKYLVVCSEGNAGFYEIGIMSTPIDARYSVLGWNHPGFEGSTGKPYPDQDKCAIDAVMQFAIHKLGFAVEDIILYGWSIGGFSTLYAASCYPEVRGIVVDASFDDVLYLAQPRMPQSLAGVVHIAIREYCNLNNAEMLPYYNGPVLLIRRTKDEIIAEDNLIDTNRGNYLALALLKYRYPNIFKTPQLARMKKLLAKPLDGPKSSLDETSQLCMSRLITYASDQGKVYPLLIGEGYTEEVLNQMAEFLLHKHLKDFNSTHCVPLPAEYFTQPWDIPVEQGFVFT